MTQKGYFWSAEESLNHLTIEFYIFESGDFFCFRPKILFWPNLPHKKKKKIQFNLKFNTLTNSNVQSSMVVFTLCIFELI